MNNRDDTDDYSETELVQFSTEKARANTQMLAKVSRLKENLNWFPKVPKADGLRSVTMSFKIRVRVLRGRHMFVGRVGRAGEGVRLAFSDMAREGRAVKGL